MAIPTISPTQSVLGYKQWEYFEFQPYATNTPTAWVANNALPTGLSLNASTGRITGAAQVPGVWGIGLVASNANGDSAEQQFTIGIEPGALVPDSLPWLVVDLLDGKLLIDNKSVEEGKPVLSVKEGDDLLMRISFVRGETVQDISLDALRLALKQYEPENVLVVSTETFEKQGVSTGTNFLLHAKFDGAALAAALSDYEDDAGTFFDALAEIEYTQINAESVGPETLIRSSATFLIRIERDLANNLPA